MMLRDRVILHSDMNSFYASVEIMLHPELKGKAVAVCGSAESRHGIVLAKSDPAKRAGIRTGMTNYSAQQLCPDLIIVKPHYDEYVKFSRAAREIYGRYTDYIEPFGMDEAWLDVTDSRICGDGITIAEEIRNTMKEELGLTVSIGVSWNKIFAKLGSDMKKPDAVTVIDRENYRTKIWPLSADEMIYAGRASGAKLRSAGIRSIGDLAAADEGLLKRMLGINGLALKRYASGTDTSRVMHRDTVIPPKSVGHGITCTADLTEPEEVYLVMLELAQDIGHRLREAQCIAGGIGIWVRDHELRFSEFQMPFRQETRSPKEIADAAYFLFRERYAKETREPLRVRQVTLRTFKLRRDSSSLQTSLFIDQDYIIRRDRAETAVEEVRRRFGSRAVIPASLLLEKKIPHDGRDKVKMPAAMYI